MAYNGLRESKARVDGDSGSVIRNLKYHRVLVHARKTAGFPGGFVKSETKLQNPVDRVVPRPYMPLHRHGAAGFYRFLVVCQWVSGLVAR
jgi:hypothetical protein